MNKNSNNFMIQREKQQNEHNLVATKTITHFRNTSVWNFTHFFIFIFVVVSFSASSRCVLKIVQPMLSIIKSKWSPNAFRVDIFKNLTEQKFFTIWVHCSRLSKRFDLTIYYHRRIDCIYQ